MRLKEALEIAAEELLMTRDGIPPMSGEREAAAVLRRAIPFVEAAEQHFAGERNYASVVDAYRAWRAAK